jgi:hypothetical protein
MKKLMIVLGLAALLPLAGCATPYDVAYGGYDHGGGPYGNYGVDCPPGYGGGDGYGMGYAPPSTGGGGYYAPGPQTYYAPQPRRGYYGGGFYGSSYGWAGQPGYTENYGRY